MLSKMRSVIRLEPEQVLPAIMSLQIRTAVTYGAETWKMTKKEEQALSLPLASAQDDHLQRMRIPEAAYMYN